MKRWLAGRLCSKQGFSLIEQLYALLLLMIAVILVAPIMVGSLQKIKNEDFKVKATNLAQEMIESARSAPYTDLNNGTYTTSGSAPTPSTSSLAQAFEDFKVKATNSAYLPSGSGSLVVQPATAVSTSSYLKEVKVMVQWKERQTTKSYELPTYIYKVARD